MPAIIDALRRDGTAHWPLSDLPDDFASWRRAVRRAAREADLRISVRRLDRVFYVEHLDHVTTDTDMRALMDVMDAVSRGEHLDYDQARHARARERLRVVTPEDE